MTQTAVESPIAVQETPDSTVPSSSPRGALTAGVIGTGKIAEQHLRTLQLLGHVHVAGICDLSAALARFTAERFGIAEWHTDYLAMLEDDRIDVVHVLTPPATHERIVRDCLDRGCDVIVEKPIALSNAGFLNLWRRAESAQRRLVENHNYRFNRPIMQIERALTSGRIGQIREVEVRMNLGIRAGGRYADENCPHPSHGLPAGVIHEFISHLAYLMLHFMPSGSLDALDSVRAIWRNHGGGPLFKYDSLDACVVADGVHGRIRFSCDHWPDCLSVQVRGTDGMAAAELFHPVCRVDTRRSVGQHLTPLMNSLAGGRTAVGAGFGSLWRKIRNQSAYEGLSRFLTLTYDAIASGGSMPVSFEQMNYTSRLIDLLLSPDNAA